MKSDEFIREVDEAVRQERWLILWRQYRTYLIGGAIALTVGIGGGYGWIIWSNAAQVADSRRFVEAEERFAAGDLEAAAEQFRTLAEDGGDGIGTLARLRATAVLAQSEDSPGREQLLQEIAASSDNDLLGDLGRLVSLQIDLDGAEASATAEAVAPLTSVGEPWRFSALELQALARLAAGDEDGAAELLTSIVEAPEAPSSLSRRAVELLDSLDRSPETDGGLRPEGDAAVDNTSDAEAVEPEGEGAE